MAAINSTNKTLSGDSQNCDVTLNGQPSDKNLSVKVSAAHTVTLNAKSDLVTLVSNNQSPVVKDSNNMPYRMNSIQYAWRENRNTQGSIDGTISIKAARNASNAGEFYKEGLYDGALPLTISGLKLVPTSNTRSEREVNATITCTIPVNTSTNDLHGGTYTFTSDMSGKQGFDANVRGMFQTYYNEEEPFGVLKMSGPTEKVFGAKIKYDADGWKDYDYLTPITPCIYIYPNLPSIKYGDVGGRLSITQGPYGASPTPSQCTYNFGSNSNFWTSPSDKSNAHVDARDITCNYSFSRFNSKNANTDEGTFIVHQEGGDIDPLDPEITYTWDPGLPPSESAGEYFTWQLVTRNVTATKNDGKTQTFSYTTGIVLKPTTRMDGKKPKLNGTITLGTLNSGTNKFGTSEIDFSNGVQVQDRNYNITCKVNTNYVTNDTIGPRSVTKMWTCPGAKWTVNPEFTVNLKVSYKDGNGVLHDSGPQIPGTSRNASVQISKDGSNYSNTIDYTLKSGTWTPLNTTIKLSKYNTFVSMSDNTPADSDGTGGNSGTLTPSVSINVNGVEKNLSQLPSSKCNGLIKIVPKNLSFNPSKTSSFPEIKWVVKASITDKTSNCTGTLTLDDASKERTITQPGVAAQESNYQDAKATITIPSWCTWAESGGNDSLKWTHEDTSSTKYTYFIVDANPITDFSWKVTSSSTVFGNINIITYSPSESARSANITVTMPTGIKTDTGASSFTQKIYQNLGDITGKIKVESVEGYGGITKGQLIDWNTGFNLRIPAPRDPKVNYTVSISVTSGVDGSNVSPNGATISGTITTGGSKSPGDDIKCYAKLVLTGTNNDKAKYEGTQDEGFKEFSNTVYGATSSITEEDYDIRCYDGSGNNYSVSIDKEHKTFSIDIDPNTSTNATISKVEWTNPNASNHDNDLTSNPFKVTATKGTSSSARTIYIDTSAPGKSWVNAKTLTQQVKEGASVSKATQTFSIDSYHYCQPTVGSITVSIPSSKDSETATGPSVDIKTGNSSDGCLRNSSLPSDATSFNATVSADDNSNSVSFFSTTGDQEIKIPVYYGGSFYTESSGTTAECGFSFNYSVTAHPAGKPDMKSSFSGSSTLGRVTGCKAQYSLDNKNWTNFTGTNRTEVSVVFKSSEISTRYTEDHKYTKKVYVRIVDSTGNVLTSSSGTATLTVYGVKYYNS